MVISLQSHRYSFKSTHIISYQSVQSGVCVHSSQCHAVWQCELLSCIWCKTSILESLQCINAVHHLLMTWRCCSLHLSSLLVTVGPYGAQQMSTRPDAVLPAASSERGSDCLWFGQKWYFLEEEALWRKEPKLWVYFVSVCLFAQTLKCHFNQNWLEIVAFIHKMTEYHCNNWQLTVQHRETNRNKWIKSIMG